VTRGPRLTRPNHVHVTSGATGATFVLNARSGHWHVLNPTAAALWHELQRTGDADGAIQAVANRFRQPASAAFRAGARRAVTDLTDRGLVTTVESGTGVPHHPLTARGRPTGFVSAETTEPGRRAVFLAHIGLLATLCLLRLPFHLTLRAVVALTRTWCARSATRLEALATVAAVEAVADRYPGRVACLERSLGSVVTAALTRRRLTWVIGVADDPCRFHAWVEDGGIVVTRSPESRFDTFNRALST
jgi:hypothetical protein